MNTFIPFYSILLYCIVFLSIVLYCILFLSILLYSLFLTLCSFGISDILIGTPILYHYGYIILFMPSHEVMCTLSAMDLWRTITLGAMSLLYSIIMLQPLVLWGLRLSYLLAMMALLTSMLGMMPHSVATIPPSLPLPRTSLLWELRWVWSLERRKSCVMLIVEASSHQEVDSLVCFQLHLGSRALSINTSAWCPLHP